MTEDFALIDFALVAAPPGEVAQALGRARIAQALAVSARGKPAAAGKGMLSRLFRRGETAPAERHARESLTVQPPGTLDGPIVRAVLADLDETGSQSPFRLTAPIGTAGMTLIEFRDGDGDTSAVMAGLSHEIAGREIFCFRYSGSLHPGAHFAFLVYRDGRCTRQAASSCPDAAASLVDWQAVDAGMPHPLETDNLADPQAGLDEVMNPVRQASILEALGIDPETLFAEPGPDAVVLELTADPGGQPLSEAAGIAAHRRRSPPVLTAVTGGAAAPQAPPPASASPDPMPWEKQVPAPSWEEEVTTILLAAVEAALPETEQVAWLESLTRRLESGDIDTAFAEAQGIIDAGKLPPAEKHTAAARLAELFGKSA